MLNRTTVALTDIQCRTASIPSGKDRLKLTDGGGLYLLMIKNGKYWRMDYRHGGKRKTLALGVYPTVGLKEARKMRDENRLKLAGGIDPAGPARPTNEDAFIHVAKEWFEKKRKSLNADYADLTWRRMENNCFPWIGAKPIASITPADMLELLTRIETRGSIETAHKIRTLCSQIFRYAVITRGLLYDPAAPLVGALTPRRPKGRATIIDPKGIGKLLKDIDGYAGGLVVRSALRIAAYVFVRPGELRRAEWSEIDLVTQQWRIPAEKMKMGTAHIVPLSRQVMDILTELRPLTGNGRYVFPSMRGSSRPMSENAVNAALRTLEYGKEDMCGHGFRAMASTRLHEMGWPSDVIERQLAHAERNRVKAAYNYAQHLPERTKMMQVWADYLDELRNKPTAVRLRN